MQDRLYFFEKEQAMEELKKKSRIVDKLYVQEGDEAMTIAKIREKLGPHGFDCKQIGEMKMSMTKDQIRLREATEKFFELLLSRVDPMCVFHLCASHEDFWVAGADGDPCDMANTDSSPLAKAFCDFVKAARDVGLDIEGLLKQYTEDCERLRKIGETIDPATAETTFWFADMNDPYCVLHPSLHEGQVGREHFARNPGGEWVHFRDLPKATRKALWARDQRKLTFPYGLHPDHDIINKPPHTAEA